MIKWIKQRVRDEKIRKAVLDVAQVTGYTAYTFNDEDDTLKFYKLVENRVSELKPTEFLDGLSYVIPDMKQSTQYIVYATLIKYMENKVREPIENDRESTNWSDL